jgi:monofunctional biosynthetic peptidoglycan transglycosylase
MIHRMTATPDHHSRHQARLKAVRRARWKQRLRKILILLALLIIAGPPLGLCMFRSINPPGTPLMTLRSLEGTPIQQEWVDLADISPHLRAAVIAGEDNLFCTHYGVDVDSLTYAYWAWRDGKPAGGASTISMQTTKNLFLWLGRTPARKLIELYGTAWMEVLWPKHRIMEVYLNIAEWGPGIFGAEAAAQYYFKKPAAKLTRVEASRLAAILPNPLNLSPVKYSPQVWSKARTLRKRMRNLGTYRFACVGGKE